MNIILAGCGKIGKTLLSNLIKEKHSITVIDLSDEVVKEISNSFDVIAIQGNATSYDVLKSARIERADIFICTTASDEVNMLGCFIAKKMGAKHTVARVRDEEYSSSNFDYIKNQLGLSMAINPELTTAHYIYNLLNLPSATKVETFTARAFELAEFIIKDNASITDIPLYELRKKINYNFLVCIVRRGKTTYIPDGNFKLAIGDKISILSPFAKTSKLVKALGFEQKPIKSAMIIGASKISKYLCELLSLSKTPVTVIEKDGDKALSFTKSLKNGTTVVKGDGMNQDLLLEHGIEDIDSFISLTNKDEQNILTSIYAKNKGVAKVITKINKNELGDMSSSLDLDSIVSPKNIIADNILRYVRALENSEGSKIETLYTLMDKTAEAIEFTASEDFNFANIPLKDLKIKKDVLIAGIIRNGEAFIPCGTDVLLPSDKIIIISKSQQIKDLSNAFLK